MLLRAAMTPLNTMEETYKVMTTIERYNGIAICVYVCIYAFVTIGQKTAPIKRRCLCCLLLVTGILGFFYLESGFLYFDLAMIVSLICAVQKSEKVNGENENNLSRHVFGNI